MRTLAQILLELASQDGRRDYALLCRAIEETVKSQPAPPAMDALCRALADAGEGPDELLRSMADAVEDLCPDVPGALGLPGGFAEEAAPEVFISAAARYLWEQSRQAEEPRRRYSLSFDSACGRYGILVRSGSAAALFPGLTEDPGQAERIVRFLRRYRIPPEALKEEYLSGRLRQPDPAPTGCQEPRRAGGDL